MASVHKEISIDAPPELVWDGLRDFHGLDEFASGFVTASRPDGDDRIVTFVNGSEVREVLVALDEGRRRLSWTIVDGPYSHHNGVAQVFADNGGTRFVWTADLLPDEMAEATDQMMGGGIAAVKETMERKRESG